MVDSGSEHLILKEYNESLELYKTLDSIISEKLNKIVKDNKLFVMEVSHRVKTFESLKGKIEKRPIDYSDLKQLTDICGARIICFFSDTVDSVAAELEKNFDVKDSYDKADKLAPTQFGYLSKHYILSLKKNEGYDENLLEISFEVQIRSVLQHAWAEIEHDLGYKSTFGVPRQIRREFSRIAGLLEIADNQFVALRKDVKEYEDITRKRIAGGDIDGLTLDQITLNTFVATNSDFNELVEGLAEKLNVEYFPSEVDKYIRELLWLDVNTLSDFYKFTEKNIDVAEKLLKLVVGDMELDLVTSGMVIRHLCRAELINAEVSDRGIFKFMQIGAENDEIAMSRAEKFIALKNRI